MEATAITFVLSERNWTTSNLKDLSDIKTECYQLQMTISYAFFPTFMLI